MLTKTGRGQSLPRSLVPQIFNSDKQLSLRLRDAPIGVAALGSIVSCALTIRAAALFGAQRIPVSRALSIVVLFFAPALLGAIYSLVFEKSKVYSIIALALAGIALRMLPFAWYWVGMYLPFVCALAAFCAVVRLLQHRRKR
jgi:hypothetical protein